MKITKLATVPLPKSFDLDDRPVRIDGNWSLTGTPDELTASVWRQYLPIGEGGAHPISLTLDPSMDAEAYRLSVDENGMTVVAGSQAGLRDAAFTCYQTMNGHFMPRGTISDCPDMTGIRGYHLNLNSLRHTDMPMLLQMLRWMAESKLNTVMTEYAERFPLHGVKDGNIGLSVDDVLLLNKTARSLGMDVIPHIQTFGHLDYLLSRPEYESIREVKNVPQQVCPLNPDSLTFAKSVIDEYIDLHPGCRYIHIGGDETRQLGACPDCHDFVEKYGVGRLYAEYMNKLIDYVASKGLTPMIYDDMVCAHPEALDLLDRRAVLVYWDYWATSPKTPHLLARYGHVYLCDKRWRDGTWTPELLDTEREVLDFFVGDGNAVDDMVATLGPDYMARYGAYLGDEVPKRFKAFPYYEYYMDQGFKVVGMPAAVGNTDNYLGLPNLPRFTSNIRICSQRAVESGALGVISSMWFRFPTPYYAIGICTTGEYTWGLPAWAPDYALGWK